MNRKSRRRFERSGVKIYLIDSDLGETGYAASPDAPFIFMTPQFVLKSRHPHVADSFRFPRVSTMDHRCRQYKTADGNPMDVGGEIRVQAEGVEPSTARVSVGCSTN